MVYRESLPFGLSRNHFKTATDDSKADKTSRFWAGEKISSIRESFQNVSNHFKTSWRLERAGEKISRSACTPFLGAGAAFGSLPLGDNGRSTLDGKIMGGRGA
jgi:hypothetical protein